MTHYTIEEIRTILRQTPAADLVTGTNASRQIDVHVSDGYREESNRTLFFCVLGSPNKVQGWIVQFQYGLKVVLAVGRDGPRSYYFRNNLKRTTQWQLYKL